MMPPPNRAAWKWAQEKRILPDGSAEPGPFNPYRTPWIIGVTEAIHKPHYNAVTFITGSQTSKTDGVILNSIGHQLDDDPLPIMYIGPTRKNVESISSDRVAKMIRNTRSLYDGLAKGQKDKIVEKFINGVRLGFGWAGSATELASHPAAKVFVDERDRMGGDVDGEGDVNTLADARTATYDGCVITTSTPLSGHVETETHPVTKMEHWRMSDDLASPTWALWQEGSRHEWAWPCPSCHEYFTPRFKHLNWPDKSTVNEAFKKAKMACPHCGELHSNRKKEWMNARGVFVAPGQKVLPHAPDDTNATMVNDDGIEHTVMYGSYMPLSDEGPDISFWVSGLCSPWRSYGHRARTFLKAVQSGEPGRIQAAINTGFGELYNTAGDAPDWRSVESQKMDYGAGELPEAAQRITMGVDVQKNRLVYSIRAWGYRKESWKIESGELFGDTDKQNVWDDLAKFREKHYSDMPIHRCFIDSGYRAEFVYAFCRKHQTWAFPTKGHDSQDKPIKAARIDVTLAGKSSPVGLQLWHLDSDYYKSWIHTRVEWGPEIEYGWHLDRDTTEDYCKQIVAEGRTVKPSGKVVWIKLRKDNHFLDCEQLNTACADSLNVDQLSEKQKVEPREEKQKIVAKRTRKQNNFLGDTSNWLNR